LTICIETQHLATQCFLTNHSNYFYCFHYAAGVNIRSKNKPSKLKSLVLNPSWIVKAVQQVLLVKATCFHSWDTPNYFD